MTALACALALAAMPAFVAKTTKVTMPLTIDKQNHNAGPKLSADETRAIVALAAKAKAPVAGLAKRWQTWEAAPDEMRFELYPGAVLAWPGATWVVLYSHLELQMGTEDEAWLVAFDPKGAIIDGGPVADWSNNEAAETLEEVTFTADGTLLCNRTVKPALHDLDEQVIVTGTSTGRIVKGRLEPGALSYTTVEGAWVDEKTKEELFFVHSGKVFYRAGTDKPLQPLNVEGELAGLELTLRFKGSRKPYAVKLDEARTKLDCTAPNGKSQTFTRIGWAR